MAQKLGIRGIFTSGLAGGNFFLNDAARDILIGYPGMANTLFAFTAAIPSVQTNSRIFEWNDETIGYPTFKCSTANNSATSLTMDNDVGNLAMSVISNVTTGEDMYVTAQAGNVLTVIRGFGGTTPAAVTETDQFIQIAQATPEASYLPPPKYYKTRFFNNFIQKIVTTTEMDEDALKEKQKEGYNAEQYLKERTLDDHLMQVERALMFGKKSENVIRDQDGQDKKLYTTAGVMQQISTNRIAIPNGQVTLDAILDAFSIAQEFQVKGKSNTGHIAFVSSAFLRRLNTLIRNAGGSYYELTYGMAEYGIKVATLETGFGTVRLIPYRLFDELVAYRGTAVMINPALMQAKYFERTRVRNFDVPKFVVLNAMVTQMGLQLRQEQCHAVITGLLGDAPST